MNCIVAQMLTWSATDNEAHSGVTSTHQTADNGLPQLQSVDDNMVTWLSAHKIK